MTSYNHNDFIELQTYVMNACKEDSCYVTLDYDKDIRTSQMEAAINLRKNPDFKFQMLLSELLFKIKIKYNAMSENYHYQTPLRNSFICMDDLVGEYSVD